MICKRLFLSTTFIGVVTGCASHVNTRDRMTESIRNTGEYTTFARGVQNPVALMVEDRTPDAVEVGMFEDAPDAFHRGGSFRVHAYGGVEFSDPANPDWQPAHPEHH